MALEKTYQNLTEHILDEEGQCVLILGPELSVNQSGVGYRSYFRKLAAENQTDIKVYFKEENLFAFKDDAGFINTRTALKEFYRNAGDAVLLELIARIRFPLIINLCPDVALNKVYEQKNRTFEPGYFSKDAKAKFKDLPYPTKDTPVIYNIFGSVKSDGSLILTHSKLYETIEYLLPEKSLPDNLETFLNQANSFILLGVKFDSWYYQLICHKLKLKEYNKTKINLSACSNGRDNMDDGKTGDGSDSNETVSIALRRNFDIQFTPENPVQAIERIIAESKNDPAAVWPKDAHSRYSVFVSYAWRGPHSRFWPFAQPPQSFSSLPQNARRAPEVCQWRIIPLAAISCKGDRETVVDWIERFSSLKKEPLLQFFRDHNDLDYGDSIDSFMTRIGKGKTVIRVISDKYLKSAYCMTEAIRMKEYEDNEQRILTIVWENADLNQADLYRDYWKGKCQEILENIEQKLDDNRYDSYLAIYRFITPFFNAIRDEVHLRAGAADFQVTNAGREAEQIGVIASRQQAYNGFIDRVTQKIKHD